MLTEWWIRGEVTGLNPWINWENEDRESDRVRQWSQMCNRNLLLFMNYLKQFSFVWTKVLLPAAALMKLLSLSFQTEIWGFWNCRNVKLLLNKTTFHENLNELELSHIHTYTSTLGPKDSNFPKININDNNYFYYLYLFVIMKDFTSVLKRLDSRKH